MTAPLARDPRWLEHGPTLVTGTTEVLVEGRTAFEANVRSQLLHAAASQRDARAARRAEAVLAQANLLGPVAATRIVPEP